MHAGPLEALVHLHSEHSHVLSETEGTQSILVCRIASLWPEICGRWADRALELPRGKSTAPCHLSSPWHCACWNQTTSPLQMRQYIRCWINEWWNLDRLKWKKKKSLRGHLPNQAGLLWQRWRGSERVAKDESEEGTKTYLSDTQLDMQQNILILRVKLDVASYLMIRYTWWHAHWHQEEFGYILTLFVTNYLSLETKHQTKWSQ